MIGILRHPLAEDGLAAVVDGFGWWRRTLWELVPLRFRPLLAPRRSMLVLEAVPNGFGFGRITDGRYAPLDAARSAPGELVILRLATSQVLHRRLDLPVTSDRRLRALLGFEIERRTPLMRDQAYFYGHVLERNAKTGRMSVDLIVAKRHLVDTLLVEARSAGFNPRIVAPPSARAEFWQGNLLPPQPLSAADWRQNASSAGLMILCAGLLIAVVNAADARQAAVLAGLRTDMSNARQAAEQTQALRQRAEALASRLAFLPAARQQHSVGRVLDALAGALPDDTWLVQLELEGANLRLQGNSTAATGLIGALDAVPGFADAHFTAPLTRAISAGAERFALAVTVKGNVVP